VVPNQRLRQGGGKVWVGAKKRWGSEREKTADLVLLLKAPIEVGSPGDMGITGLKPRIAERGIEGVNKRRKKERPAQKQDHRVENEYQGGGMPPGFRRTWGEKGIEK